MSQGHIFFLKEDDSVDLLTPLCLFFSTIHMKSNPKHNHICNGH